MENNINFYLAQIFGIIALILTVIGIQFKTKEKIVLFNILGNIALTIQYFLLNAVTGGVIAIINTIRCIVYYIFKKKDLKTSIIVLLIFEIAAIISGVFSWQNYWSLLPIVVTVFYTYGLWQDNITIIRIATGMVGLGWSIYDIVVKAYVGALQETSQLISAIISLCRNRDNKRLKDRKFKIRIGGKYE